MNELLNAIPTNDFQKFLLWGIGLLISVIGFMYRLYATAMNKIELISQSQIKDLNEMMEIRVNDKQVIIDGLLEEVKRLQLDKDRIIGEIKPSLDASNSIAKSVLNMLQHGSK